MRLACSSTCFPMDRLEIALAKASWAGFRAVELEIPSEPEIPEEALLGRLRANGLEVAAISAGEFGAGSAAPTFQQLTRLGRLSALARRLDCGTVVVRPTEDADPGALAQGLALLDRALGEIAVQVCLRSCRQTVGSGMEFWARLWDHGLPRRVGIALDPAEVLQGGEDPSHLHLFPELPRHVYLSDASHGKLVPPGEGALRIEALAGALRERGYAGSISLALSGAEPWAVETAVKAMREEMLDWFGVVE